MPALINDQTRKQVIHQWISGDTRDKIAIDNSIGEGTVSSIVNEWKRGLEDSEYESVRHSWELHSWQSTNWTQRLSSITNF
jgi:hypothetical protein